jgi:hypothetical protein
MAGDEPRCQCKTPCRADQGILFSGPWIIPGSVVERMIVHRDSRLSSWTRRRKSVRAVPGRRRTCQRIANWNRYTPCLGSVAIAVFQRMRGGRLDIADVPVGNINSTGRLDSCRGLEKRRINKQIAAGRQRCVPRAGGSKRRYCKCRPKQGSTCGNSRRQGTRRRSGHAWQCESRTLARGGTLTQMH